MADNTIFGSGELADLIRKKDWSSTPLGPISSWNPALLTSVNMMLAVPTPIQIFWGDEMTVLYNTAFVPLLTHKHPTALGASAREVWAEAWSDVGAQLEAVFAEGVSFDYRDLPLTLLQHGRPVQGFFTFSYSPIRDGDGTIVGLLNISQNTTTTVRAQQSLQQSEYRFRSLVQHASVGIAIGNTTGELTYLNPALLTMLNYTTDDFESGQLRWDKLTPAKYAQADQQAIEQLRATGVAEPYEKAYCNKQGQPVPLLIGASVIPADKSLAGDSDVAVFATDLRKQKRAEGALLQNEKLAAVGKLASSISHEINNPLEAVTNLLFIVRQDPSLSQSSQDFLATADRELARVSQVTQQTLRFHRQSSRPQHVDPKVLLEEVLQLYAARLRNFNIKVISEYAPDASLTCYEGDIRQVLNNLIGNAVDAMRGAGGRLTVRTRCVHRGSNGVAGVLITVADTGSGMTEETRKHIFDAFYTTKGINGTGLGLWISCRIVHKHRGYVRCTSSMQPERHGTVFHLWLPEKLASTAREAWHEDEVGSEAPDDPRNDDAEALTTS